jgi:glycosyltransferase involved in cell wall biosynthesis
MALPAQAANFRTLIWASPKYSWHELVALPLLLRREGADLLHSPHYVLPPRCPCPAVVTIHDLIHLRFPEHLATPLHQVYARMMLGLAVRRARRIITVSEHSRRDIVRLLGAAEDRVQVVPNGVDPRFRPVQDEARLDAVRRRYELPKRFVLSVGNINPHKNVLGLLQAFERVGSQEDLDLVLVGESVRQDGKVQGVRAAIARARRVRHIPRVPHEELPAFYTLAEMFVTPSLYEGFGLTPLEAMACGAPLVAGRTSSLPEVLGDAPVWVDPTQPESIAAGLLRMAGDEALRKRCIASGLARAQAFSWRRAAEQTLEVYRQALGG